MRVSRLWKADGFCPLRLFRRKKVSLGTIAPALLSGPFGPFIIPAVDPAAVKFSIQTDVSLWPLVGGDALTVKVDETQDGGASWNDNLKFTIPSGTIKNEPGLPVTTHEVRCALNYPGTDITLHQLRVSGNALIALTTGFVVT